MNKKILVIDDEKDFCELIRKMLIRDNYLVDCAFSLQEAADKLQQHPNIVLLDNNLPDGLGIDYLMMHPTDFLDCAIIMITADPTDRLRRNAAAEGVVDIIEKPFSVSRIKETLKRVLN